MSLTGSSARRACLLLALVFLLPCFGVAARTQSQIAAPLPRFVDCDAGGSIQKALRTMRPGETLFVRGTCMESVEVTLDGVVLDGLGTATISGPDSTRDTLRLVNLREATVRGFRITGGRDGIHMRWVTLGYILNNTIEQTGRNGIQLTRQSYAHISDTVIQNNPRNGIEVQDSRVRIGHNLDEPPLPAPNLIQGNGANGVFLSRASAGRINGNTIRNNGQNGIAVEKMSHADIASNTIEGNTQNGIRGIQNSGINLGTDSGTGFENSPNSSGIPNGLWGIECSLGAYADGRLGSLTGARGPKGYSTGANDSLLP